MSTDFIFLGNDPPLTKREKAARKKSHEHPWTNMETIKSLGWTLAEAEDEHDKYQKLLQDNDAAWKYQKKMEKERAKFHKERHKTYQQWDEMRHHTGRMKKENDMLEKELRREELKLKADRERVSIRRDYYFHFFVKCRWGGRAAEYNRRCKTKTERRPLESYDAYA